MLSKDWSRLVKTAGQGVFSLVVIMVVAGAPLLAQRTPNNVHRWSATRSSMLVTRSNARSVSLTDGRVLITGGISDDVWLSSAEFYGADGGFSAAPAMMEARSDHACSVLPDGDVIVAGGRTAGGMTNSTEIFDRKLNAWRPGPSM